MTAVPEPTPVTTPLILPTVATVAEAELQVPPPGVQLSVVVPPDAHNTAVPVTEPGIALTVTIVVTIVPERS